MGLSTGGLQARRALCTLHAGRELSSDMRYLWPPGDMGNEVHVQASGISKKEGAKLGFLVVKCLRAG